MRIPSFPADEVTKAAEILTGGDDDNLLRLVKELRGLANDAKPIIKMVQEFRGGFKLGQEKGKDGDIKQLTGRGDLHGSGGPGAAGITEAQAVGISQAVVKSMIVELLDMAIKMGYGDKTLKEVLPEINFKIVDIRAFIAK